MIYDVIIAGAGVIGGMAARELSKYELSVCLLEKENDVACGASKANSGIIHGGYDPEPGTLKAKLNVEGVPLLYEAAKELNVSFKNNGSLIVAFGKEEEKTLEALYERGIKNGVSGMKIISGDEARNKEPNLSEEVTAALLVPTAGIICPYGLTLAAVGNAMDNGVILKRNFEIAEIQRDGGVFTAVSASGDTVSGRFLINCAGTHADKIAELAGDGFFEIIPRAGEYMLLDKTEGQRAFHTVFQVPTKKGKGVLVTPTADGNLLVGPTAEKVEDADGKQTTAEGLAKISELAKKSVPSVNLRSVITSFAGIRASEKNGDFIICASEKVKGLLHIAAIDSPGLSSCVAIARYALDILRKSGLSLTEKKNWDGTREDTHAFLKMSDEEKNEYIKTHPAYGRIVCRCESVSEGEIRDAVNRNPGALDVDGVKRRTRAGMGRCQGGFCSPHVMKIIAEENNVPMEKITKKGPGSEMVIGKL